MPVSYAKITTWMRSRSPSFMRIRLTWVRIVDSSTMRLLAISRFERPRAISPRTPRRSTSAARGGLPRRLWPKDERVRREQQAQQQRQQDEEESGCGHRIRRVVGRRTLRTGPQDAEVPDAWADPPLEPQSGGDRTAAEAALAHHVRIAEQLAHDDPAAGLDHTAELAQGVILIGDLAEDGDEVRRIEAGIGVRQAASVSLPRLEVRDALHASEA